MVLFLLLVGLFDCSYSGLKGKANQQEIPLIH